MPKQKLDNKNKTITVKQLKEFVANLPEQNPHTGYDYQVYIGWMSGFKSEGVIGLVQDDNGNLIVSKSPDYD